jgi:hypothetical protein
MSDFASGKSVKQLKNEIRIVGKAGAKSICLWSYPAFFGPHWANPNKEHIKMVSTEFDGKYEKRPPFKQEMLIPTIPSRRNLVKGGSFEALASELKIRKLEIKNGGPIGGKYALVYPGGGASFAKVKAEPGEHYTISAYIKLPGKNTHNNLKLRLSFFNKAGKVIYVRVAPSSKRTDWQRIWITRIAPIRIGNTSKTAAYVQADFYNRGKTPIAIDGFKLEKGIMPSEYCKKGNL